MANEACRGQCRPRPHRRAASGVRLSHENTPVGRVLYSARKKRNCRGKGVPWLQVSQKADLSFKECGAAGRPEAKRRSYNKASSLMEQGPKLALKTAQLEWAN